MSLEEAILEKVRDMPPEQQEEMLRLANEIEHRSDATPAPVWDGRKEMAWIEQNRAAYMGLWVALDGDRLVAAGPDGKKVYEAAKAQGVEIISATTTRDAYFCFNRTVIPIVAVSG
jgi:Family of unknown function (DUF5678)